MFDQKMLNNKKEKEKTCTQSMLSSFLVPKIKKTSINQMSTDTTNERNDTSISNSNVNNNVETSIDNSNATGGSNEREQR